MRFLIEGLKWPIILFLQKLIQNVFLSLWFRPASIHGNSSQWNKFSVFTFKDLCSHSTTRIHQILGWVWFDMIRNTKRISEIIRFEEPRTFTYQPVWGSGKIQQLHLASPQPFLSPIFIAAAEKFWLFYPSKLQRHDEKSNLRQSQEVWRRLKVPSPGGVRGQTVVSAALLQGYRVTEGRGRGRGLYGHRSKLSRQSDSPPHWLEEA